MYSHGWAFPRVLMYSHKYSCIRNISVYSHQYVPTNIFIVVMMYCSNLTWAIGMEIWHTNMHIDCIQFLLATFPLALSSLIICSGFISAPALPSSVRNSACPPSTPTTTTTTTTTASSIPLARILSELAASASELTTSKA